MDSTIKKIIHLLLIACIAALYTLILPAHGHEDLLEHTGCVLCQLSNQAATVAAVFILVFVQACIFVSLMKSRLLVIPVIRLAYPTRAPPLFRIIGDVGTNRRRFLTDNLFNRLFLFV